MGEVTNITWADHTFNPWIGCTEVSVGEKGACVGCYARELAARYGMAEWGNHPRHRTSPANWKKPLQWDRNAAKHGTRPFVFCASLADVFDNQVDPAWRRDLFALIRDTPHLTWLLLTKRPQNIVKFYNGTWETEADGWDFSPPAWPRNAAIGCTVVTQAEADRDVRVLLDAKAALRPAFAFLSMEPLVAGVDLTNLDCGAKQSGAHGWSALWPLGERPRLDWVITGGETDQGKHKARPSHPDWFRSLRDQCADAGVAYHHKQNGEWVSVSEVAGAGAHHSFPDGATVRRIGKKLAGRTIDGRAHDERPALPVPS